MTNKTSLTVREMQIKAIRYYFIPTRMALIKKAMVLVRMQRNPDSHAGILRFSHTLLMRM
jgi:hypothetical protein